MKPTFTYALRYWVEVTCETPLRTGSAERDIQEVLRRWDGTPFLQGSSLAGALRAWQDNDALFGSPEREGTLIVSDLLFQAASMEGLRPRLRIDGAVGAGADGGKFDVAALLPGTKGSFELVWCGSTPAEEIEPVIEAYLAAMNDGQILLGAQKSNGFGRVSLSVERRKYDLMEPADLKAWLEDEKDGESISLHETSSGQIVFQVTVQLHQLLVKAAGADGVGEKGVDAPPMTENGSLLLPGSSIKGAIRAHMEKTAAFCFGGNQVLAQSVLDGFLGRESRKTETGTADNGIAGKARFEDAVFGSAAGLKEVPRATRIRINRLTGGVMRGALFTEQPVAARCRWNISVPADEIVGCALLLFALRDLGLGLFSLGSGNSIGHGRADQVEVEIAVPGKKRITLTSAPDSVTLEDTDGVVSSWLTALKEVQG